MNSFDLLKALKKLGHIQEERDPWWWPNSGTLDVVVGALLTQQTRWEKVEESLSNLQLNDSLDLSALAATDTADLREQIRPTGFYNTKAERLKKLAQNIQGNFGNFDTFRAQVTREWLLGQTGIGLETADSILCYACNRPVMVADAYSQRLLNSLGIEANNYCSIQSWLAHAIDSNADKTSGLYDPPIEPAQICARFHGKIVEYCKMHSSGKSIDTSAISKCITR